MDEVLAPLRSWTEDGAEAGLATLVSVRRSAPRRPGARFAVSGRGDLAGSVSSGCVEGDLHEHLQRILEGAEEPRVVHYGITDEMAMEVGLACGGEIDVLVGPFDPDDPVWEVLEERVEARAPTMLVTGLSEGLRTRTLLVPLEGDRVGTLGDEALDRVAGEAIRPLFDTGGTDVLELEDPETGEVREVFAEAYLPPPRLAVVGATPVARALTRFAKDLGYEVVVVDPRTAFAREESFPEADRIVNEWPDEGLRSVDIDRYLNVVVLAHDRKLDVPALAEALRAGCLYVGQIGGGRTQRIRREALAEEGFDEETIARVRGPVGLDIGAVTPEEIALSIAAEMVAVRRGKGGEP